MDQTKQCAQCKRDLDLSEYSKVGIYYIQSRCKVCLASNARKRWSENKEHVKSTFLCRLEASGDDLRIAKNLDVYFTMKPAKFHQHAELKTKCQSWYRYERLGVVERYVNDLIEAREIEIQDKKEESKQQEDDS